MKSVISSLLLLASVAIAAPVETAQTEAQSPESVQSAAWGTPQCQTAALYDLCTAKNAGAYCDAMGFHNSLPASCKGMCYCE
ncbi:hypothetical protein QBC46DRAFT_441278 [Diplogelasinospora grovesii]|uniref:Uncharacterized protein n=1 Tax=Diplogelasinospora grovesii TaxID=303347 RepID=A0AAN6N3R0_9PEZI|nr:hypothetical protein QBC46DRAFT_441278 [Diplogelasinospora grovesii]